MRDFARFTFPLAACLTGCLAVSSSTAYAQARPRPVHHGRSVVVVGAYYHPFFDPYPWYLYPWYPFPFAGYPPYGAYPAAYDLSGSIRMEVTPREAEVYVDAYLVGTVDDFDGFFQRLHLPPGEHTVELHLDGYRSVRQKIFLTSTVTYRFRYRMEPLQPGETSEARPTPPAPNERPRPDRTEPSEPEPYRAGPATGSDVGSFGTLSVRVQPEGAEVMIDGERWQGPDLEERLLVQLSSGMHRVEIRKDGYQSFTTELRIEAGETETLNVSLPPGPRR